MDGWIFQQGNDTNWAKENPDVTGWKKLKPTQLSIMYADNTGKAEGWFRIKIRLSDSLMNQPIDIKQVGWAASDLFINGKLIHSVGNTGLNGQAFEEHSPNGIPAYPVDIKPGKDYTLAYHVVDYVSPLPPGRLKTEKIGLRTLLRITGPNYNSYFIKTIKESTIYSAIWVTVCAALSILFWLLYFQNREERNLQLIAIGTTLQTFVMFSAAADQSKIGMSFTEYLAYNFGFRIFAVLTSIYTIIILVNIFRRKVATPAKIFLVVYILGGIISFFLKPRLADPIFILLYLLISMLYIYYIISSWKKLKGAQWTIVVGLLFSLLCGLIYTLIIYINGNLSTSLKYLIVSGYSLSFPLSLLVYVSMRFKEIIHDVRQNAAQVVQLSAEKEQQALNQKSVLEEEVKMQTAEIRNALDNLKSTQTQLIQSEKMASLGELTAGIAHEIQNPLNFVNNFSEVSKELLDEMKTELNNGNTEDAKEIADDVIQNLEKINHHGKRADAIVKGMLQHSQSSTGKKEPIDINA
ncbi:MAG: histidine kinase dimerization/phospho-acceptor domain-containing protein, partial [Ferruginibacter sp.]